ncbi:NAD(P)/FAD-dependent oxidoreductase [Cellulosimicrobium sp. NPDC057862]|uniref:NAD(P)/FAD-dependent oxidoreductase n=1 Tax=Cellulosimicrobium sp. NPDC057862 TaxID=3346266 RepID=UPI00366AD1A4
MERIVVVGGGYAGFTAARELEKRLRRELRRGEVEVVLVDPRPYMTYQPFLPEVVAGSVEARHAAVAHRSHLHRTRLVDGTVERVDHARRAVVVRPRSGEPYDLAYDTVVVTAGAVTRVFPVPGVAEHAIGMKHVEEAVAIRDRLLTSFDRAASLPAGPERERLLTVTFVGGGFSGVEGFAELLSLAHDLTRVYPRSTRQSCGSTSSSATRASCRRSRSVRGGGSCASSNGGVRTCTWRPGSCRPRAGS